MHTYTITTTDNITLRVYEYGDKAAPPVVLIHGIFSNHLKFRQLTSLLAPDYRVICYDQRGHGESEEGAPQAATIEQLGRDLDSVIKSIDTTEKFYLLGHSMGAMTIASWANLDPHNISRYTCGVTLTNTAISQVLTGNKITGFHPPNWGILRKVPSMVRVKNPRNNVFTRRYARYLTLYNPPSPADLNLTIQQGFSSSPQIGISLLNSMMYMDLMPALQWFTVPTTVIAGAKDRLTKPALGRNIANALASYGYLANFTEIQRCGHVASLDQPDIFHSVVCQAINNAFPKQRHYNITLTRQEASHVHL